MVMVFVSEYKIFSVNSILIGAVICSIVSKPVIILTYLHVVTEYYSYIIIVYLVYHNLISSLSKAYPNSTMHHQLLMKNSLLPYILVWSQSLFIMHIMLISSYSNSFFWMPPHMCSMPPQMCPKPPQLCSVLP